MTAKLLNAVTSTGAGPALFLGYHAPAGTFQFYVTGTGALVAQGTIQGSHDGLIWTDIQAGLIDASGTGSGSNWASIAPLPPYIRANLTTLTGTGATFTAWYNARP